MCDYSLTDNPAESDMPTEAEPWQPVDLSEVEEKMGKLSTKEGAFTPHEKSTKESASTTPLDSTSHEKSTSTEAVEAKAEAPPSPPAQQDDVDFGSEPEEVALKVPLVSAQVTLPGKDAEKGEATLPASPSTEETPKPKGAPEAKAPPAAKSVAKAPPPGAQSRMEDLLKLKPFLRIEPDVDSDAAAAAASGPKAAGFTGFTPPSRAASLSKSALKPRAKSKSASRPPSKGPEKTTSPKRGSTSPPRQPEPQEQPKRKKTVGAISSSYFTGYTPSDLYPAPKYQFDHMPRDLHSRYWKQEFLAWTLRDLKRSWGVDSRAFVNLHVGLYLYDATAKYPIAHPRAFAACSVAGDANLPERFCCWTCRKQVPEGEVKTLWPDMFTFTQHWHVEHASDLNTEWTTLALYGGVTIPDLAWELLGIDLEETPLPRAAEALPTLPRVMPHKRSGHNPRIYGHPWNVHQPLVQYRRPVPPSHPPPSHMLPSLNVRDSEFTYESSSTSLPLMAVNKTLRALPDSSAAASEKPVILKAAPSSQRTKVPLPQSTAPSTSAASGSTDSAGQAEEVPLFKRPKELEQEGTKFQTQRPAHGFTLMGWQNPLGLWAKHLQRQIAGFTTPSEGVYRYSCDREEWHSQQCKPSALRTWFLRMEEHVFYLFTIKCVASVSLTSRSSLSAKDREKALAMCLVAERDLRDELSTMKTFMYPDSLLPYVTSTLEHIKGVIELRVPMAEGATFPLAPRWSREEMPIDDDWERTMYREL